MFLILISSCCCQATDIELAMTDPSTIPVPSASVANAAVEVDYKANFERGVTYPKDAKVVFNMPNKSGLHHGKVTKQPHSNTSEIMVQCTCCTYPNNVVGILPSQLAAYNLRLDQDDSRA